MKRLARSLVLLALLSTSALADDGVIWPVVQPPPPPPDPIVQPADDLLVELIGFFASLVP